MSQRAFSFILLVLSGLFILVGAVVVSRGFSNTPEVAPPTYKVSHTDRLTLSAKSWIVYDVEQGDVLLSYNPRDVRSIASVTKLPAAAVLFDMKSLDATTTVTWSDLNTEGESGRLAYGEIYSNRQLLFPLLLESSNDAAVALARSNPALIERMNELARQLELADTRFIGTSGLDNGNVSTAQDLMQLSRHIYENYPYIIDITTLKDFYVVDNGWLNNSPFEADDSYRGGKHGFTYKSNRTATAFFSESISGQDRVLGYVLLGSDDLETDMDQLRAQVRSRTTFD